MTKLEDIKALTPAIVKQLNKLGLHTLHDLLLHFPIRYEDETSITPIAEAMIGQHLQFEGEVVHAEVSYKPRKSLTAMLADETGQISLRFLHFYPSTINSVAVGEQVRVFGEVRSGYFGYELVHPKVRKGGGKPLPQQLTPIYSVTAGLTQPRIKKAIDTVIALCNHADYQHEVIECLPERVYQLSDGQVLPTFYESIQALHAPPVIDQGQKSTTYRQRLAYDELLAQQLSMRQHYAQRQRQQAPAIAKSNTLVAQLFARLPFKLTAAQQKVGAEISHDLTRPYPMQRLLQGDVGSGKTIVACIAALQAIEHGWQVALMAPTEILAEQHNKKFDSWLAPLDIQIAWLTGSQTKVERREALAQIASGRAILAVGTHALFQDSVQFKQLGLVIIDEQHRFGVQQRLALRQKGQPEPHQLMMTATPIPRTLSMSYYADLDVSVINELPPGRTPVITKLVSDQRREEIIARVQAACSEGRQAYWVCPLIEESEALQLQTATDTFEGLKQQFPALKVGLVHGRMKAAEKQVVMQAFAGGDLQLLVATTVIEVGVDVPNASLMIIEHAERMGLSQLHQLRGRVGRGTANSICILMYQTPLSDLARTRLKVIYENSDGFAIAQEDLNIRGPGEYLGTRQSGVPMLKVADLSKDEALLVQAKEVADRLIAKHPDGVAKQLERWMGHVQALVKV